LLLAEKLTNNQNYMKSTLLKTFVTIALTVVISLTAKGQNKKEIKIQKEIDSLFNVFKNDPSAFKKAEYMLEKSKSIQYNNGILASYLTLIYKNSDASTKDSFIKYCNKFELLEKLHPNPLMNVYFLSYKGQGLEVDWGLPEEGLKYYLEAYELVKKINPDDNLKINVIRRIANSYKQKKEYNKALKLLLEQIKDTGKLSYHVKRHYLLAIANTYQVKEMPEKSNQFINILLKLTLKNKDPEWYLRGKIEIFANLILMKNYKNAIDSCLVVQKKLLHNNSAAYRDIKQNNTEYLSSAYQDIGDYQKAILYLKEVIRSGEGISDNGVYIYDNLINCYEKSNDLKQAMDIYKKKNIVIDTARARERKAFVDYYDNQVKTINIREAAENIILKNKVIVAENKRQKLYISILLVSLLTAGLLVVLFILGKKYKVTKDKVAVLKKNEVNILKNHIKVRENELSAMLLSEAKKTEKLDQIKTTLSEAVKNNDREQINVAQKSLNQYLKSSEEFGIFSERLESQYPGIVHQLKGSHPELSQNDMRHCLLVKLGLSLKESASLLNVTPGTVKNSRNRVIRKLDLPEDINFKQYLDQVHENAIN
jgi:tetratricopeptide (TPR) repeat protein